MNWPVQCGVVIPCLNEGAFIGPLVHAVRRYLPFVVVVDDGSTDTTVHQAAAAGAHVLQQPCTKGKGAALMAGTAHLASRGLTWVVLMDGDGQHSPQEIPRFLHEAELGAAGLIVGNRMNHPESMPMMRRLTNRWMSRRLSVLTGRNIPDSQCGFRMLPLELWERLSLQSAHYEIESEMLFAAVQAGDSVRFVPIATCYGSEITKINVLRDTWRWVRWWARARRAKRQTIPPSSSTLSVAKPARSPLT